jgi:hypothetical protein
MSRISSFGGRPSEFQDPSLKAVAFHLCWSGLQVTNQDDLVGNDPKFPVGALRSAFEDANRLILRATESGHQDPLGYASAVSSEDCLYQIVTRVDSVDCEAGGSREQHGNVGLVSEGTRSAGPPHECHGCVGLGLTLRGNHEKRPPGSQAAWKRELAPSPVLAEVVNAVDVLKPSFCGDQLDDLLPPTMSGSYTSRMTTGRKPPAVLLMIAIPSAGIIVIP